MTICQGIEKMLALFCKLHHEKKEESTVQSTCYLFDKEIKLPFAMFQVFLITVC